MKKYNKFTFLFLLLTFLQMMNADVMRIQKVDGTYDYINIHDGVNITFLDVGNNDKMHILKTDNTVDEYSLTDIIVITFYTVSIDDDESLELGSIPISLLKNYPNPFNPDTKISFNIDKPGFAVVSIYNQKGEFVKQLMNREVTSGSYELNWNGEDEKAKSVASGCYFTKVSLDEKSKIKQMLLLK